MFAAGSGGGYGMAKTSNAAKPLSSICLIRLCLCTVNRSETLTTRKGEKDVSAPPPKQGGHAAFRSGSLRHTSTRPHGVAHVLIYPCGKAWKNPPFPSRFIVADRSSPSRVRFAASRPGRLRADPKDALLTRGKGGGCRRDWGAGDRGQNRSAACHMVNSKATNISKQTTERKRAFHV